MPRRTLPSIGFDRFLTLEWMDLALNVAMTGQSPQNLRDRLAPQISGAESLRKTLNALANLWLMPYPETEQQRRRGIELADDIALEDRIVLHWGMALANFPLFRTTTQAMGRLLRLHGDFLGQEISTRVLEYHGGSNTLVRCVQRILQSVTAWDVVRKESDRYRQATTYTVSNPEIVEWLFETVLCREGENQKVLIDLLRTNELFPFDLTTDAGAILHDSPKFLIFREGLDREMVKLVK